jgi:acyl-coenzyme A synthetase/AMP-(fatty) acid ligase
MLAARRRLFVLRPGQVANAEELIAWSRLNMANYKVPREIEFHSELPKNAAGKVLRSELRRLDVGTSPR